MSVVLARSIMAVVVVIETANPTIESVDHALAGLDHEQQRDRSTSQASRCATEQRKENSELYARVEKDQTVGAVRYRVVEAMPRAGAPQRRRAATVGTGLRQTLVTVLGDHPPARGFDVPKRPLTDRADVGLYVLGRRFDRTAS